MDIELTFNMFLIALGEGKTVIACRKNDGITLTYDAENIKYHPNLYVLFNRYDVWKIKEEIKNNSIYEKYEEYYKKYKKDALLEGFQPLGLLEFISCLKEVGFFDEFS